MLNIMKILFYDNRYKLKCMKIFAIAFIFFILQNDTLYERHNQFCGSMNSSDIKWKLEIKENKTYSFRITEQKNAHPSKKQSIFLTGSWERHADTLKLTDWTKDGNTLFFYEKENTLVFQALKSKIKSRPLVFLDYLEK